MKVTTTSPELRASAESPTSPGPLLGIGQAARACDVSERSLRYYQQIGLLTPSGHTPGGLRRYAEVDLARVRRIRELQAHLGLNLDEIRSVLDNEDRLATVRVEYRSTRTGTARRAELLQESLAIHQAMAATVDAKLAGLKRFRAEVDASVRRVKGLLAEMEATAPKAGVS